MTQSPLLAPGRIECAAAAAPLNAEARHATIVALDVRFDEIAYVAAAVGFDAAGLLRPCAAPDA